MKLSKAILTIALTLGLGLGVTSCNEDIDRGRVYRSENEQAFLSYKDKEGYQKVSLPGLHGDSYVYAKWTKKGGGTIKPKLTDRVRIRYRSYLLTEWNGSNRQGLIYSNYTEENPKSQNIATEIEGVRIALQNMVVGDEVTVIIPWYLGLGGTGQIKDGAAIQAYTSLLYQLELLSIND